MNAKTVFRLQRRQSWLSQLSADHSGRAGHALRTDRADLSGTGLRTRCPAHRI